LAFASTDQILFQLTCLKALKIHDPTSAASYQRLSVIVEVQSPRIASPTRTGFKKVYPPFTGFKELGEEN